MRFGSKIINFLICRPKGVCQVLYDVTSKIQSGDRFRIALNYIFDFLYLFFNKLKKQASVVSLKIEPIFKAT